jgi:hypothetical protein
MKISTILDHIDSGHMALPEFQRGYDQPVKMADAPLWIDVTELMQTRNAGLGAFIAKLSTQPELSTRLGDYVGRLGQLLGITAIDLHEEQVTGADKSLDVVVDSSTSATTAAPRSTRWPTSVS